MAGYWAVTMGFAGLLQAVAWQAVGIIEYFTQGRVCFFTYKPPSWVNSEALVFALRGQDSPLAIFILSPEVSTLLGFVFAPAIDSF